MCYERVIESKVIRRFPLLVLIVSCLLLQQATIPRVAVASPTLRVALYVGAGAEASEFVKEFENSDDESILYKTIDGDDIRRGVLDSFDALLVPGGSASMESRSMGAEAHAEVRRFVSSGGIYMGVCAGAYLASTAAATDLGMLPLHTVDREHWYRVDEMTRVDVELTALGMEAFGIDRARIRVGYENGPIFSKTDVQCAGSLVPLGFFRSEVVGDGGERGVMLDAPAIILSKYGRGNIIVISPHFEETPGYKQVQLHALKWQYRHRDQLQPTSATSPAVVASTAVRQPSPPARSRPPSASVLPPALICDQMCENWQNQYLTMRKSCAMNIAM